MRGFDFDGAAVAVLPGYDAAAFPTRYGAALDLKDVGAHSPADLVAGPGPDPTATSRVTTYMDLGDGLSSVGGVADAFPGLAYGVNVTGGRFGF